MSMQRFFRDNSKKVMALFSVVLMVLFFLPSLSGSNSGRNGDSERTVATVYGNEKITAYEQESAKQEWGTVIRQLFYVRGDGSDQQRLPLAAILGQPPGSANENNPAVAAIENNPVSFLLLIKEAQHLGLTVSNDQLQQTIKDHVENMPDEADETYPRDIQAVHDLLLVSNLLDRVSDVVKESGPRTIRNLAVMQQDVSLNVVTISLDHYLPAATQPTHDQAQSQFNLYSQTLAGNPTASNPLGFGYLYPDRVKVQYIGFTTEEIRRAVKESRPIIEWETLARRLYRLHTSDFPVPTTNPTTQPIAAATQPAWEDLPGDVVTQVYNRVYDTAADEATQKIQDAMNQQLDTDWLAFHNAAAGGTALPMTSFGVTFDTDDYMRDLAASLQKQFGAQAIVSIDNGAVKNAGELAALDKIGTAVNAANGATFAQYATIAGDQFKAAAALPASERLALWQPSQRIDSDSARAFFIFRLSAMDPSHAPVFDEVRDQVTQDVRKFAAWNAATADADKLLAAAKLSGLVAAAQSSTPPPSVVTTDFFSVARAVDKISPLPLQPVSIRAIQQAAGQLLIKGAPQGHQPSATADLPADREIAIIELNKVRPDWTDPSDRSMRQTELGLEEEMRLAQQVQEGWSIFDAVSKRTQYQETAVK